MSLTPDYFISSSGYPQLNREKFKTTTGTGPPSAAKFLTNSPGNNSYKTSRHLVVCCDSDKKKLLKRRGKCHASSNVISMTVTHNSRPCKWANDKERKCYINQQIKEMESNQSDSSNNSSQQLDNRLASDARYLNGILRDNQTDATVLQSLDF